MCENSELYRPHRQYTNICRVNLTHKGSGADPAFEKRGGGQSLINIWYSTERNVVSEGRKFLKKK